MTVSVVSFVGVCYIWSTRVGKKENLTEYIHTVD